MAGVDDAIMLDVEGYVAETNATNIFLVRRGAVHTPLPDHCLPGITRATVIRIAEANRIPVTERRVSLSEFHSADEVFTTGTMGELVPVLEIDGRRIGNAEAGPVTTRLQALYARVAREEVEPLDL